MRVLKNPDLLNLLTDAVSLVDHSMIHHGKRTAFIVYCMMLAEGGRTHKQMVDACMLTALHDIGAYKTEGLGNVIEFETLSYWSHSIYSYIFLKATTPMQDMVDSILYHHVNYPYLLKTNCQNIDLADKIHLADRIDILLMMGISTEALHKKLRDCSGEYFGESNVELFLSINEDGHVVDYIKNGEYDKIICDFIGTYTYTREEVYRYLRLLIYFIDFRSEVTVSHTLTVCTMAKEIAKHMGLGDDAIYDIEWGAIFHDVGKIAIPVSILEKDGKLTAEEMEVMKYHVVCSEEIITPYIDEEIVKIAVRHHEKLDGSGYPHALTAEELTLEQRIMAVADILSALAGQRSYKDEFDKDKIISIISSMAKNNKICPIVSAKVIKNYDAIMQKSQESARESLEEYNSFNEEYNRIAENIMEQLPHVDIILL